MRTLCVPCVPKQHGGQIPPGRLRGEPWHATEGALLTRRARRLFSIVPMRYLSAVFERGDGEIMTGDTGEQPAPLGRAHRACDGRMTGPPAKHTPDCLLAAAASAHEGDRPPATARVASTWRVVCVGS